MFSRALQMVGDVWVGGMSWLVSTLANAGKSPRK
jgi:hypothetical protein